MALVDGFAEKVRRWKSCVSRYGLRNDRPHPICSAPTSQAVTIRTLACSEVEYCGLIDFLSSALRAALGL